MTFRVEDSWIWDFWLTYDPAGARHHMFFLHAPTHLGDPAARHRAARIGHASSPDLRSWTRHADPLPEPVQGLDDLASWTGSVFHARGRWWMFTSGLSREEHGTVQRIGSAWSGDLLRWTRTSLILNADTTRYASATPSWPDLAWRDPWLVRDETGLWHMYVTARDSANTPGCGVIGHATSQDLTSWDVGTPLSAPTGLFEHLEVISLTYLDGQWILMFSCLSDAMPTADSGAGGIWYTPVEGPGAQVDIASARRLTDESLYVGKIAHHLDAPYLMAFHNNDAHGEFIGGVSDPLALRWYPGSQTLELVETAEPPR